MADTTKSATFAINLAGNAGDVAKSTADSMQALRDRIASGTASIRDMNGSLKNLRGNTAEVKAAKDELVGRIVAEKQAIAAATLESIKQQKANGTLGKSIKALSDEEKKRGSAIGAAISTAGGPLAALSDKLGQLKAIAGEGGAGGGLSFLALGVGATAAAFVALTVAVVGSLASLGRFIVHAADGARSTRLLREAAMGGNAEWGKNFGEQVEALGRKVPTSRAALDALGISLAKQNIGGRTMVDTMNAVAQASAALGDDAGAKIKSFVERAMIMGRPGLFRISPQELIGTGVTFREVAESLGTSMHIGVDAAQKALFSGRVKLEDGAAALRAAVEKKVGGINLRQMLSLDVMARKLGETFDDLTKGVDLEPLLKGLKEIASMFDLSTTSGRALKQLVGGFGNEIARGFSGSVPLIKSFIYGIILGAQDVTIAYLETRNAIRKLVPSEALSSIGLLSLATTTAKVAVGGLGVALAGVAVTAGLLALPLLVPIAAIGAVVAAVYGAVEAVKEFGPSIIRGLVDGMNAGLQRVKLAAKNLADAVKNTFRDQLGIHSPSTVFAEFGANTTEGYGRGVERGTPDAQGAVDAMIAPPRGGRGASGGASGGVSISVPITIHASGGNAADVAAQVSSASVLEQITSAVVDALRSAGIPVPS